MASTRLRVKEMLRERRWTTKVLAEKTGLSESYLTHIKNATRRWNEDSLRKLAVAFEVDPIEIFAHAKDLGDTGGQPSVTPQTIQALQEEHVDIKLKLVPVVGQIPSQPTQQNNRILQKETGCEGKFVAVTGYDNDAIFCLQVQDHSMIQRFSRGDLLVVVPGLWTSSGDIVALEYQEGTELVREIAKVSFNNEVIVVESISNKRSPHTLMRDKDQFRIIGKVVSRYQNFV